MRVQVLGPVRAWRSDGTQVDLGSVGQRAVLGLLAVHGGNGVSRADLVDALWGRNPPPTAVNIVQTRVKHLRRRLEPGRAPRTGSRVLPRVGDGYALRIDSDLKRFRELAVSSDADAVRTALELWHGPPLADVPALAEHPSILAMARERQATAVRYGEMMIAKGAAADVLPVLEEAAAEQPLDEAVQARLIRAYQSAGRRAKAFTAFHAVRKRLADELGVTPGPDLTAANEDMLHGHPDDTDVSAEQPTRSMLPADIPVLTGRDAELSELDEQLSATPGMPICVITGPAGAGKTALAVHAAHRQRDRYPDGQLYVDLRRHPAERDALDHLLGALGVRPGATDVADQASMLRTALAGQRVLVVLDNASSAGQVRALLPGTDSCAVIVTSRDSMAGLVALHGAHRLDLAAEPDKACSHGNTAARSAGIRIQVLGPLRVWRDGVAVDPGSVSTRAVLGLLALSGGQPVSRADIIEVLWQDDPPPSASNVIQAYVRKLRHLLEPGRRAYDTSSLVPRVDDGYALHVSDVDVLRFRHLLTGGDDAEGLRAALRLWHGPPLADVPVLAGHKKVLALVEQQRTALARYGEEMIGAGSAAEVIGLLEDAATEQPLDEAALARLIRAYQSAGRGAQAHSAYRAAKRRLADELGVDPGPELAAAYATLAAGRAVPAQLPADVRGFSGRATELSALDAMLARHVDEGLVCVVSGSAGVGKTALAVRFGHQAADRFPGGQLYVDLRGFDSRRPLSTGDVLVRLLGALGVVGRDIPADTADRAERLRAEITGRGVLLVLDNANSADQVRPFLPCPPSCAIVVTSRDLLVGLSAQCHVGMEVLSRSEALTLLTTMVGARARAEPEAAVALVEQCARLPLALRVAAELVVSRSAVALSGLVEELADRDRRLVLLDSGGDHRAAVAEVFSWSYRHLGDSAARAFRLLGLHPGLDTDVTAAAALFGVTTREAGALLDTLGRAHLVHTTTPGRWGMHDLLRAFATALADNDDTHREALERLSEHYVSAAAATDLENTASRMWLDAELANLTTICAHMPPRHAVRLATALYRYLDGGRHVEALTIHTQAEQAALRLNDLSAQAHAVTNLGSVHWQSGRYDEAAQHYRRALRMYLDAADRAGAARALTRLGNVEEQTGQYQHAAAHHAQALAHARAANHPTGEARALTNLGIVSERLEELDSAADLHTQALEVFVRLGNAVGEAVTRTRLGMIAMRTSAYERAMVQHERALAIARDLGHLRGEAHSLINIGDVYLARGMYPQAAAHYSNALTLCEITGHEYGRATALNGLGDALGRSGMRTEAHRHHTAALAVAVKIGEVGEQERARAGLAR